MLSVSESISYIFTTFLFFLHSTTISTAISLFSTFDTTHPQCHHHLSQAKLEVNENAYEMEDNERKKFEKPFATLEMEYNQIQERRRLAEEKRQEEIRELELKTKAAILIQAWWRGYSVRKALKNKAKSKKAKSDKGKGKGKKTK